MIAFSGLNSYIDLILLSVRGANHAVSYDDTKAVDLVHLFPTQIGRLIVRNAITVNFTSLINLQSLLHNSTEFVRNIFPCWKFFIYVRVSHESL